MRDNPINKEWEERKTSVVQGEREREREVSNSKR